MTMAAQCPQWGCLRLPRCPLHQGTQCPPTGLEHVEVWPWPSYSGPVGPRWLRVQGKPAVHSLPSAPLPYSRHCVGNERDTRKGHFLSEIMLLSTTDTLRKASKRERFPRQEKEKLLLACQEIWTKAFPGGLLEHTVYFCSAPRRAVLEPAINGLAICKALS